jgi:hypothetical protein
MPFRPPHRDTIVENRGHMIVGPVDGQRAAIQEDKRSRLPTAATALRSS